MADTRMDHERALAYVIMDLNPLKNPNNDHRQHIGFYPYVFEISQDIFYYKRMLLEKRRAAIRKLFERDMKNEDEELRIIGRAYLLTQP